MNLTPTVFWVPIAVFLSVFATGMLKEPPSTAIWELSHAVVKKWAGRCTAI